MCSQIQENNTPYQGLNNKNNKPTSRLKLIPETATAKPVSTALPSNVIPPHEVPNKRHHKTSHHINENKNNRPHHQNDRSIPGCGVGRFTESMVRGDGSAGGQATTQGVGRTSENAFWLKSGTSPPKRPAITHRKPNVPTKRPAVTQKEPNVPT